MLHSAKHATDESIVAFASVRNSRATSDPSFGDWQNEKEQQARGVKYLEDVVPVMIEVSRGSPNKYEIDKETGQLVLDRVLHSAVFYPGDYGYVPQTLCGDGDPLDILIINPAEAGVTQGLDTGVVVNARVIAVMDMEDESGHDEKLIAVIANQRRCDHIQTYEHLSKHIQSEIQHFFENYKVLEVKNGKKKWAKVLGWGDKTKALEVVKESRETFSKKTGGTIPKLHPFVKVPKCPNMLHIANPVLHQPAADGECMADVVCYINVSKNSLNSYIYRHDTSFRHYKYTLDMPYPGDYGWICQTWQPKLGKPLEILILSTFPLCPESLADARIIGAMSRSYRVIEKGGGAGDTRTDWKILAVLPSDPRMCHVTTLGNLNEHVKTHLSEFFVHTATIAGCTESKVGGVLEAAEASKLVREAHADYLKTFEDLKVHNAANLWSLPWTSKATMGAVEDRIFPCIIETPKECSCMYGFDNSSGSLKLERTLASSTHWPANLGFIPQTVAEDGRAVDVLILSTRPLQERSMAEIRIVGAAECIDEMGPDMKVIGVPKTEPRMKEWKTINTIPGHMKDEMVHFLNAYKDLEESWKFCRFQRWLDAEDAVAYLQLAHTRYFLFVLPMQQVEARIAGLEDENIRLRQALVEAGVPGALPPSPSEWQRQSSREATMPKSPAFTPQQRPSLKVGAAS